MSLCCHIHRLWSGVVMWLERIWTTWYRPEAAFYCRGSSCEGDFYLFIYLLLYVIQTEREIISLNQFGQSKLFGSQSLKAAVVHVAAGLRHSLAVTG